MELVCLCVCVCEPAFSFNFLHKSKLDELEQIRVKNSSSVSSYDAIVLVTVQVQYTVQAACFDRKDLSLFSFTAACSLPSSSFNAYVLFGCCIRMRKKGKTISLHDLYRAANTFLNLILVPFYSEFYLDGIAIFPIHSIFLPAPNTYVCID